MVRQGKRPFFRALEGDCLKVYRVLFVCLGNICRSPTAEGVCRHLVAQRGWQNQVQVDSAGTGAWHVGEPPDQRSQAEARRRGVDLGDIRARAVTASDFENFDAILAMDSDNLLALRGKCPAQHAQKLSLLLDFAPSTDVRDVPDPYYGSGDGFRRVFDLVEAGCEGFLKHIEARVGARR